MRAHRYYQFAVDYDLTTGMETSLQFHYGDSGEQVCIHGYTLSFEDPLADALYPILGALLDRIADTFGGLEVEG